MIKLDEVNTKNKYVGCRESLLKGDPKAITLIALVITIVVLIILAGVAINLTLGENGILKRAEDAKLEYQIAQAKEELDLKIAELQTEKQGTATLNDLMEILKDETDMDYIVSLTEIASITGVDTIGDAKEIYVVYKIYQFKVDEKLDTEFISIVENYAPDVTITSNIKSYEGKNANGKYIAKVEVKVESKELAQKIEYETVNGLITEVPAQLPYTKEIEVEIGNKYITKVTAQDGKVKKYVVEEKKEETISSVEEFAAFRDAVNSGLTYEGKTISLTQDIDLSSICGENVNGEQISWEPIGTRSNPFKGTFDGNRYTIEKIYINTAKDYQGLFGNIKYSEIKNLTITDGSIVGKACTAGIVGDAFESNILKCSNSISISGITETTGGICGNALNTRIENCTNSGVIVGGHSVGGVAGTIRNSQILQSYNKNIVKTNDSTSPYNVYTAGGIVGVILGASDKEMSIIENSYNIGDIYGYTSSSGIIAWIQGGGEFYINNCYSIGKITGNQKYAIYSYKTSWGVNSPKLIQLSNNYWITGCGASSGSYDYGNTNATSLSTTEMQNLALTLGDAYVADGKIKNSKGEWVDNIDESGNIIYINNGYPILKWQVEE